MENEEKKVTKNSEFQHHEHHEHHVHHSHHSSSGHLHGSVKNKKWYQDPKKKTKYTIYIVVAALIFLIIGIITATQLTKVRNGNKNYCTYSIVENELNFNGNNVVNICIRYGDWDVEITEDAADVVLQLSDNMQILYNGTYSGTIYYKDGTTENFKFTYDKLPQPIELTEDDGIIYISTNKNYRVNFLYYVYGQALGDPYARYISLDNNATSTVALGKGVHTFRINATSEADDQSTDTYYVAIDVKSTKQPTVFLHDDAVGLFAYGFNVTSVAYTEGQYNSWEEMKDLDTLYYSMCNINLDRADFKDGPYTFCFLTPEKNYFINMVF